MGILLEKVVYTNLAARDKDAQSVAYYGFLQSGLKELIDNIVGSETYFLSKNGMDDFFRAMHYMLDDVTGLPREISLLQQLEQREVVLQKARKTSVIIVLDKHEQRELAYLLIRQRT